MYLWHYNNTSWETKLLGAARGMQTLLKASYVLGPRQIILGSTWWLFIGSHSCIDLASLKWKREYELEQKSELVQEL